MISWIVSCGGISRLSSSIGWMRSIVFGALDEDSMRELPDSCRRQWILAKKNVTIEFAPDLAGWLFEQCGLDPQAGARPLRRLIKLWVEDAVADYLIQHRAAERCRLRFRSRTGGRSYERAIATWLLRGTTREAPGSFCSCCSFPRLR